MAVEVTGLASAGAAEVARYGVAGVALAAVAGYWLAGVASTLRAGVVEHLTDDFPEDPAVRASLDLDTGGYTGMVHEGWSSHHRQRRHARQSPRSPA